MTTRRPYRALAAMLILAIGALACPPIRAAETLKDLFWVWGNPEMATPGEHALATFAEASPPQRAALLGTPNIIMAGAGIPNDQALARSQTESVQHAPRIVWEILPDGDKTEYHDTFEYSGRVQQIRQLRAEFPNLEGVLLDDMTSVGIDKGFKPEHLKRLRQLLTGHCPEVKLWGVLYTMNFGRDNIQQYIDELDVINLWVWHARDLVDLEKHVAHCEKQFPGKPIVLGLYLRDYGDGKPMTKETMELQCETARRLAHAGRIQGIVFLTIDNDPEIVGWTAEWIKRVGDEPLGSRATAGSSGDAPVRAQLVGQASGTAEPGVELKLGDGGRWHFAGGDGPWTQADDGVISPPNQRNLHSRAFSTIQAFGDLTAEYEVNCNYRENGAGGAGFVFRATDATHFYAVYLPWGGQQLRANHFWISIVKADGDGYLRSLKSAYVPGVPSETDRWYKIRLEARGPNMQVWVDGRRALTVSDDTYQKGAVGMIGYGWYFFRNIQIRGKKLALGQWDGNRQVPAHRFEIGLSSAEMPSGCVAPNGDVLVAADNQMVRSKDKGRTWGPPETLPGKLGKVTDYGNTMFRSGDRLVVQTWATREETKQEVPAIHIAESTDNGLTWSDPVEAQVAPGWPEVPATLVPYGPLVQTADGTWVRFLYGNAGEGSRFGNVVTWGSVHCKAYAIRSTDQGKTWSAAIEVDQPSWSGQPRGSIVGALDLTEPTGVAVGNRIVAVVRPIYSPFMWQLDSADAGATWDAAARTTFPGYAQSMARTASGAILVAHRTPHYAVQVSRDDGLHWDDGTIIDWPNWAMGCLVEVEPDVVLCTYMNASRETPLLAQLIRVTPQGIEPVGR